MIKEIHSNKPLSKPSPLTCIKHPKEQALNFCYGCQLVFCDKCRRDHRNLGHSVDDCRFAGINMKIDLLGNDDPCQKPNSSNFFKIKLNLTRQLRELIKDFDKKTSEILHKFKANFASKINTKIVKKKLTELEEQGKYAELCLYCCEIKKNEGSEEAKDDNVEEKCIMLNSMIETAEKAFIKKLSDIKSGISAHVQQKQEQQKIITEKKEIKKEIKMQHAEMPPIEMKKKACLKLGKEEKIETPAQQIVESS